MNGSNVNNRINKIINSPLLNPKVNGGIRFDSLPRRNSTRKSHAEKEILYVVVDRPRCKFLERLFTISNAITSQLLTVLFNNESELITPRNYDKFYMRLVVCSTHTFFQHNGLARRL